MSDADFEATIADLDGRIKRAVDLFPLALRPARPGRHVGRSLPSPTRVLMRVEFGDGTAVEVETKGPMDLVTLDGNEERAESLPRYRDPTVVVASPQVRHTLTLTLGGLTAGEDGEAYVVRLVHREGGTE